MGICRGIDAPVFTPRADEQAPLHGAVGRTFSPRSISMNVTHLLPASAVNYFPSPFRETVLGVRVDPDMPSPPLGS